jgi:TM2 domain-containing membrane protein YozV
MADLSPRDLVTLTDGLDDASRITFQSQFASVKKDRGIATILAIFTFDRFYLGQIGLGILKWASCFVVIGFIWYIVDIFTAAGRADTFNRTKAFAIADALKDRRPPPSVGTSPPSSPDLADGN